MGFLGCIAPQVFTLELLTCRRKRARNKSLSNAFEAARMVPSIVLALRLAKALQVPVEELFSLA